MESILTSIKKLLPIEESDTHFDQDIVIYINNAFSTLTQLGAGPAEGFSITDASAVWSSYEVTTVVLGFVKTYIYLKVKLIFDPPASSAAIESIKALIAEAEWRICSEVDPLFVPEPVESEEEIW